jgi:hypothetical protein
MSAGADRGLLQLAQLAQLRVIFAILMRVGISRIKELGGGERGFERVVPTLGIFF